MKEKERLNKKTKSCCNTKQWQPFWDVGLVVVSLEIRESWATRIASLWLGTWTRMSHHTLLHRLALSKAKLWRRQTRHAHHLHLHHGRHGIRRAHSHLRYWRSGLKGWRVERIDKRVGLWRRSSRSLLFLHGLDLSIETTVSAEALNKIEAYLIVSEILKERSARRMCEKCSHHFQTSIG